MAFQYLDKRVQRTKSDLYNALMELLKQKKYEQITITDIVEFAGYSRGTFYLHYSQKDDLLNEIIKFLFEEAEKAARIPYAGESSIDVQMLNGETIPIIRHFKQYGEYYKVLLGENLQIDFSQKLTNVFVDLFTKEFDMQNTNGQNNITRNFIYRRYAYGTIGLIMDWITADFPMEPEEFSRELEKSYKYSLGTIQIINQRNT